MPLCMATDQDMFALAAKLETLPTKYSDSSGDSWEFRYSWRASRVELLGDGDAILATWVSGESGELVELFASALYGSSGLSLAAAFGRPVPTANKKGKVAKHRFNATVELVVHKLQGFAGLHIIRTDLQSLVGKKSRKTKETCEFTGDVLFEDEHLPTAQSQAVALIGQSRDLLKVEKDEKHNSITLAFSEPLGGYCNDNGERRHSRQFTKTDRELEGVRSSLVKKFRVFFDGRWRDKMPLDNQSIGQSCYKDMKQYLAGVIGAKKKDDSLAMKAQRTAKQRKNLAAKTLQKGGFASLPKDSWAKRAVEAFGLQTAAFDASVSEEEWKQYYNFRTQMAAACSTSNDEDEDDEDDSDSEGYDHGMAEYQSKRRRQLLTVEIRADFARALRSGGVPSEVADAAARGLVLQRFNVCEDGGTHPRTVEIKIIIFALAANCRAISLEYQTHHRDRMYGLEKFAFVNAQIYGPGVMLADKPRVLESFALYDLETVGKDDREKARLGPSGLPQKLAGVIFGNSIKLSPRKAFAAFLRAAGVDVHPACSMPYYFENGPVSLYRRKHKCGAKDYATDAEGERVHSESKKRTSAGGAADGPVVKAARLVAAGA